MVMQRINEARRRLNILLAQCVLVREGVANVLPPDEGAKMLHEELMQIRRQLDMAESGLQYAAESVVGEMSRSTKRVDESLTQLIRRHPERPAPTPKTQEASGIENYDAASPAREGEEPSPSPFRRSRSNHIGGELASSINGRGRDNTDLPG